MLLGPGVGLDFSGVVKQVGTGVTELAVGDEVFGTAAGSLAEFVTVDAGRIARKPSSLSFAQAAAMPTAYLTGLQSLRAGGVNGDSKVRTQTQTLTLTLIPTKVLVIGASGGCGSAGVQIAKARAAPSALTLAPTATLTPTPGSNVPTPPPTLPASPRHSARGRSSASLAVRTRRWSGRRARTACSTTRRSASRTSLPTTMWSTTPPPTRVRGETTTSGMANPNPNPYPNPYPNPCQP
eukprot:scaffold77589_cov66-Phaeocystis_antarctica.AAC.6